MDPFNLIYLKYFIDTVELNNVSKAAKKNFVTQSCISQGIKKLEQTLKIDLTMHLRNRFKLTEEGKIVFIKGKEVLNSLNGILDEISQFKQVVMGKVSVATTPSLALSFFPKLFQKISQEYPQIELKIRLGTIDQIHQWIKSDQVDFALVLDQADFIRYDRQEIVEGTFNLYKHTTLKKWNKVYVDSLSGLAVSDLEETFLDDETFELGSWELVAEFLNSKLGIGVLPDFIAVRYPNLIPIQKMKRYKICGFYQKGIKLTKAANAVMAHCYPLK